MRVRRLVGAGVQKVLNGVTVDAFPVVQDYQDHAVVEARGLRRVGPSGKMRGQHFIVVRPAAPVDPPANEPAVVEQHALARQPYRVGPHRGGVAARLRQSRVVLFWAGGARCSHAVI